LCFLYFCQGDDLRATDDLRAAFEIDPSVAQDVSFLNTRLNTWKPEFYTLAHANFSFWFISHLPPTRDPACREELLKCQLENETNRSFYYQRGIEQGLAEVQGDSLTKIFSDIPENIGLPDAWKQEILNQVYPALLFETYKRKQISKTRYFFLKSIRSSPSNLINRGVLSVGIRSYFG
jgi:hypothetical protein